MDEQKERLKALGKGMNGDKTNLIKHLYEGEVPMPSEKWETSRDDAFLKNLLNNSSTSSVLFQLSKCITETQLISGCLPTSRNTSGKAKLCFEKESIVANDNKTCLLIFKQIQEEEVN